MPTFIPAWVDGTLTQVEKVEAHRRGLKHPAISVFVMDGDLVLMQRRALSKYHTPGIWANACCTHPLWDEAPLATAQRRLDEELGITGLSPVFRNRLEYRADVGDGLTEHEVVDIFLAEADHERLAITPNPEEVAETRWQPLADLRADVARNPGEYTPWLRIYLLEHGASIFDAAG